VQPPSTTDLKWYVVQSKPREELRAEHFLKEKGFQVYLPLMEVAITRGIRDVMKEKPLFPSYLFCRFDAESSLAYVRWTKGVVKILPESIAPTPVDDGLITAIRTLGQKDGIIRKKALEKHDQIRITRGSMKDILGIFDYWTSDEGRVRVLLNFLNYQASVELHHSFIEKVAQ
jgi:transcriptional antiterminator RfaH